MELALPLFGFIDESTGYRVMGSQRYHHFFLVLLVSLSIIRRIATNIT